MPYSFGAGSEPSTNDDLIWGPLWSTSVSDHKHMEKVHITHRMARYENVVFCRKCGLWMKHSLRHPLTMECTEDAHLKPYKSKVLKNLQKGSFPYQACNGKDSFEHADRRTDDGLESAARERQAQSRRELEDRRAAAQELQDAKDRGEQVDEEMLKLARESIGTLQEMLKPVGDNK